MRGLGLNAKVVGLLATWAAGGVGTSSDHPGELDGPDLPLVLYDTSTLSGGEAHQPYRLADLELHDVRPRREGDDAVYVDNAQVASWLAELELTDPERKAYVVENSVQGVGIFSFFFPLPLPSCASLATLADVERSFGYNSGRYPRSPGPRQSQAHHPDSPTSRLAGLWHRQQGPITRTISATAQGPGTFSAGSSTAKASRCRGMRLQLACCNMITRISSNSYPSVVIISSAQPPLVQTHPENSAPFNPCTAPFPAHPNVPLRPARRRKITDPTGRS